MLMSIIVTLESSRNTDVFFSLSFLAARCEHYSQFVFRFFVLFFLFLAAFVFFALLCVAFRVLFLFFGGFRSAALNCFVFL